ncbi:hypothetical protein C8035_v000041 [Colletotrichum spinosum]|uniref:Uncharacterized protein n=1 Tax=Colletotrichum spinosum TaxID=1347390 RepID=A0A4R8PQ42_9PEZI|nr:hypothetical protein C8035_v000041 [Colletotrichum spinosum]
MYNSATPGRPSCGTPVQRWGWIGKLRSRTLKSCGDGSWIMDHGPWDGGVEGQSGVHAVENPRCSQDEDSQKKALASKRSIGVEQRECTPALGVTQTCRLLVQSVPPSKANGGNESSTHECCGIWGSARIESR